ncbi:putative Dna topoisomerase I, partial [Cardiosporidium cionae]
ARIFPENVILNCAESAPVPPVGDSMVGHCWGDVYHDNTVTWLAFFKDTINDQFKYMYLAAQSKFKGMQDFLKYEKARKLKDYVGTIRANYTDKMKVNDSMEKQLGTATYLIDFLALRVGGEKDTDEEADTVGCCSLRVEHITFKEEKDEIQLDFLGKDSIRYFNTVKDLEIDHQAFKNMQLFCKGKKPEADVFDKINSVALNAYLKELMNDLTAKVFRTYNASITLQQQLCGIETSSIDKSNPNALLQFYNDANREVAILCNHQRSIPKQHEASMEKLNKQLELLEEDIRECQEYLHHLKLGKKQKFKFQSECVVRILFTLNGFHPACLDMDQNPRKSLIREGMKDSICKNKLTQFQKRKNNLELKIRTKDDNKTVSLGTSKINYMDPRITVAFCKKHEINIEKCFNRSLRLKFPWAMFAKSDFEF